jgi:hypothetical protein
LRKKLLLLDLVLVALAALAATQLREKWLDARKREQVVLGQKLKQLPPPPYPPLAAVQPATAVAYTDVAEKDLFAGDRNPTVVREVAPPPPPPKPMPALPVFYGAMNLGDGPLAMMSAKPGETQREVRYGEKIGEFVLVALNRENIVLEWDGKKISKKTSELSPKETAQNTAAASAGRAVADNAGAASTQNAGGRPVAAAAAAAAPGAETSPGTRACVPGDNSPNGTVKDGWRKISVKTPFGTMCRWEAVK